MDAQVEANEILTEISEPKTSKALSLYDKYYGGGFMDEDGNLTIMVKGDTSFGPKIIGKKNSVKVKYQKCKYSLAELNAIVDTLNDYAIHNSNGVKANMSAWGVSEEDNIVEVYLYDTSYAAVQEFKENVSNSKAIIFLQGVEFVEETSYLYAGAKLSKAPITDTTTMEPVYGSYAFRAREKFGTHRVGMVTAAHVLSVNDSAYMAYDGVGVCTQSVLAGSIDGAFVVVSDTTNFTPSNYLSGAYPDCLSISTSLPGTGTIINMRGATSGHTSGSIKKTNYTIVTPSGVTLTNLTAASYGSAQGDSGGIIYTYVSSTSTRYTVGVHRGLYGSYKVFSKASNVLSTLNLERY